MTKETRVRDLIGKWNVHRSAIPESDRYCVLKQDLYKVRNPGFNGAPPISAWPAQLVDPDDEIMASVEHYYLCRCWIGSGTYPAWELRTLGNIYEAGKKVGLTPRHNPNKPVTPPSAMQRMFREEGIRDGEKDLARWGRTAPKVVMPPKYY